MSPIFMLLMKYAFPGTNVKEMATGIANERAKKELKGKFHKMAPRIASAMDKDGWTNKPLRDQIRDALFRLVKGIVKSGTVADVIRDFYDDKVIAAIMARPPAPGGDLEDIVIATGDALVEQVF